MATSYGWEAELPVLIERAAKEMPEKQAGGLDAWIADQINAMTVQDSVAVFGSFRTLAALLTQQEYNALRGTLSAAAATETAAGGTLLADMINMLKTPGDQEGNGGGLDFTSAGFVALLDQLAKAAELPDVPIKVAAYVAGKQPAPRRKYNQTASDPAVAGARNNT